MKILVLSMLRLGDLILHHEIIRSIRRTHPGSQISCLINDGSRAAIELIPEIDEWIVFPRDEWQHQMNQSQRWIFSPVLQLEKILRRLKSEKYDQILNLTHSVISGHIVGFLADSSREVRGLCLNENGQLDTKSVSADFLRPLQYMNHTWSTDNAPLIHYLEMLAIVSGYGLKLDSQKAHRDQAFQVLSFQLSTSDARKHFSKAKWVEILKNVQNEFPHLAIQILTAPNENSNWKDHLPDVKVIPCTLSEGVQLIRQSDVFVSHDTSLLHLASRTATPIVQISLGSSHVYKTSSLQNGTVVIAAQKSCFPCGHQASCPHPRFECHEDVDAEKILEAIKYQISAQTHRLPSRLSQVQIVDGLWWLQNEKNDRNFSQKQTLYNLLSGHPDSELFSKEERLESKSSNPFDASIG